MSMVVVFVHGLVLEVVMVAVPQGAVLQTNIILDVSIDVDISTSLEDTAVVVHLDLFLRVVKVGVQHVVLVGMYPDPVVLHALLASTVVAVPKPLRPPV
tara:strand:+ start:395 stop:691 length:297 start_codon:yes stop_codon:yes gene_type:complete